MRLELSEKFSDLIPAGSRIGIAVGSRGIYQLDVIIKELVVFIKSKGSHPFVFPAMGSHGGATAQGQKEILAEYGIKEDTIHAPIISNMDVVEITGSQLPNRIYMNKNAYDSDGIILVNRIKPHTDFHGSYESGLVKMSVIGVGSHAQAMEMHKYGIFGLRELIPKTAKHVFATGKILGGLALIEDAYDHTMMIKALKTDQIFQEEQKLLKIAKAHMPFLPFEDIDVLIVKEMGKDISGVGIDSNIIGRMKIRGEAEPPNPSIKNIVVCDLSGASHGNAIGIGLADVITQRLFEKMDYPITRENLITSSFLERGKIPVIAKNDQEAFSIALRACNYIEPGQEKIICIKNTLYLSEIFISDAIYAQIQSKPQIELTSKNHDLFNASGDLTLFAE